MFLRGIKMDRMIKIKQNKIIFSNLSKEESKDFSLFFNKIPKRVSLDVRKRCDAYTKGKNFDVYFG